MDQPTRRYLFFGRVQGVGFRYTTAGLARECGVLGYVRNRSDGSVELVAQGAEVDVDWLVTHLDAHFAGYIERRTVEDWPGETFAGFEVRR
ncbi:MAG TPA: acylphosphatase [Planctomycetaceae bacterium]|nr:acylphosphatase [Planctomycetaceae bacterium]